jgi:hypothetical protein
MEIVITKQGQLIGTLVSVDPDISLARELREALGEEWQVIEIENPSVYENSSCFHQFA